MANWLIVAVAIAMATIFIDGFYQLVSVQGPNGTYLMVSNIIWGCNSLRAAGLSEAG